MDPRCSPAGGDRLTPWPSTVNASASPVPGSPSRRTAARRAPRAQVPWTDPCLPHHPRWAA